MALLDWPEDESDDDDTGASAPSTSALFICSRPGCTRARASNPRTSQLHDFCSLKCQYLDSSQLNNEDSQAQSTRQYNVDLMIALQISRLQLLQDLKVLSNENDSDEEEVDK